MKSIRVFLFAALTLLAVPPDGLYAAAPMPGHGEHHSTAADLTKAQTKFLANYEGVRAALAADNLDAAKRSAANIPDSPAATQLGKASSLKAARVAFKKLSADAIQIAQGHDGFYIATCPMAGADWVQTSMNISNPYGGQEMATCGSIKI